ncbi:MAG: NAD(P)/FAD-dependent oxidoreductase [Candidatus Krumholzibacteriia bacterium]
MFEAKFGQRSEGDPPRLKLDSGSRVAVIGGGPAGSFFTYFLLDMAERLAMDLRVDIYDPRDFSRPGPSGCNMCGGIVSESLVQILATEGINLPPTVVQRGIDSYMLHMDVGSVRIETPLHEKRIASVHRGAGPRDAREMKWRSFDGFLRALAMEKGAHSIQERVENISWENGRPQIGTQGGSSGAYDLLVLATGVNASAPRLLRGLGLGYEPPLTTKAFIREYFFSEVAVAEHMGSSMHVFLFDLPRLEFAALVPKGDYVTMCMLGAEIDTNLVQSFMSVPEVKRCFPKNIPLDKASCQCSPRMTIRGATRPFADRVVFIGDCGETRLYKDGIGAAYRTAKAAATTAIFEGISAAHFRRHYLPVCRAIGADNTIGKMVFAVTRQIQKRRFARSAVLRMIRREQQEDDGPRRMSMVMWDIFTGSAPYREIFLRTLHPSFLSRFLWSMVAAIWPFDRSRT